ncbi:MAG TPA: tRNA preQ1(34) S-adenosylmethionine ribosyltransferase-isomerase QueA [Candidatus Didemnitutus sp.]|nr:tRNA preQ1(34) S-adenosylmethionine ribosyltransferase-isomerase QueA [Candidatus Didemnitutus sp.]
MNTDLFDYDLPEQLIAQHPTDRRDASRLLVVHRAEHRVEHRNFRDLPEYLRSGDRLFRNNAAVIPARLHGKRPTGGEVECLLLHPAATDASGESWWCLIRPGKKLPVGATFSGGNKYTATVREKSADGLARISFALPSGRLLDLAEEIGEMPLPPYIAPRTSDAARQKDRERYQTIYANRERQVAAAAPTAGLHFTPEMFAALAAKGVGTSDLTLHVGLGTFRPITSEKIEDHTIHREVYEIPEATREALTHPSGRRVAIGTTAVRTLEDFLARADLPPGDFLGEAGIFIYPPATFRGVDALVTNFHQPRSTLLCLVSAFLAPGSTDGIGWLKEIYAEAIAREYRFFSYGDAMLIL